MKIRLGFVSNSSSSSFVIRKDVLSEDQIDKIRNHIYETEIYGKIIDEFDCCTPSKHDEWDISENDEKISGSTFMDNFDMSAFLELIEVKPENIDWEY